MATFEARPRFQALEGLKRHWPLHTGEVHPMVYPGAQAAPPGGGHGGLPSTYNLGGSGRMFQYGPARETAVAERPGGWSVRSYGTETVVLPHLLEGGTIGLSLDQLEVSGVLDPMSAACGFRVGDQIAAVNGVAVKTQDELRVAVQYAIREYHTRGTPLAFQVDRRAAYAAYGEGDLFAGPSRRRGDRGDCVCGPEEEEYDVQDQRRNARFERYPPGNALLAPAEMSYHTYRGYSQPPIADMAALGYYRGGTDEHGYSRRTRDTWAC